MRFKLFVFFRCRCMCCASLLLVPIVPPVPQYPSTTSTTTALLLLHRFSNIFLCFVFCVLSNDFRIRELSRSFFWGSCVIFLGAGCTGLGNREHQGKRKAVSHGVTKTKQKTWRYAVQCQDEISEEWGIVGTGRSVVAACGGKGAEGVEGEPRKQVNKRTGNREQSARTCVRPAGKASSISPDAAEGSRKLCIIICKL